MGVKAEGEEGGRSSRSSDSERRVVGGRTGRTRADICFNESAEIGRRRRGRPDEEFPHQATVREADLCSEGVEEWERVLTKVIVSERRTTLSEGIHFAMLTFHSSGAQSECSFLSIPLSASIASYCTRPS